MNNDNDMVVGRVYSFSTASGDITLSEALTKINELEDEIRRIAAQDADTFELALKYKHGLEAIAKSAGDWIDSMVKEPAEDFVAAVKNYAEKIID